MTCTKTDELWDVSEVLCNILVHYDPLTRSLISNQYESLDTLHMRLLGSLGRCERDNILERLYEKFRIRETEDKFKFKYSTNAGWLGYSKAKII